MFDRCELSVGERNERFKEFIIANLPNAVNRTDILPVSDPHGKAVSFRPAR